MSLSKFNKVLNVPAKAVLPLGEKFFRFRRKDLSISDLKAYKTTQDLALRAAMEVSSYVKPGLSEIEAATLLDTYLRDNGVNAFVHYSFAWFGDRSRFNGCQSYQDLVPSKRVLKDGEPFILDTAPVLKGVPADIGLSFCKENNSEFKKSMIFLNKLRKKIPKLFMLNCASGEKIYQWLNQSIRLGGYENIHQLYPFGVLAHRLYKIPFESLPGIFKPFTWQAYWSLLSRGFYSETISGNKNQSLDGIWAVEPHLGADGFGVKFEEMLYVRDGKAQWLSDMQELKD